MKTKIIVGVIVVAIAGAAVYFANTATQKGSLGLIRGPRPDLIMQNFSVSPVAPKTTDTIVFSSTVKNEGKGKKNKK